MALWLVGEIGEAIGGRSSLCPIEEVSLLH